MIKEKRVHFFVHLFYALSQLLLSAIASLTKEKATAKALPSALHLYFNLASVLYSAPASIPISS